MIGADSRARLEVAREKPSQAAALSDHAKSFLFDLRLSRRPVGEAVNSHASDQPLSAPPSRVDDPGGLHSARSLSEAQSPFEIDVNVVDLGGIERRLGAPGVSVLHRIFFFLRPRCCRGFARVTNVLSSKTACAPVSSSASNRAIANDTRTNPFFMPPQCPKRGHSHGREPASTTTKSALRCGGIHPSASPPLSTRRNRRAGRNSRRGDHCRPSPSGLHGPAAARFLMRWPSGAMHTA